MQWNRVSGIMGGLLWYARSRLKKAIRRWQPADRRHSRISPKSPWSPEEAAIQTFRKS
jgi:hypothetical protein